MALRAGRIFSAGFFYTGILKTYTFILKKGGAMRRTIHLYVATITLLCSLLHADDAYLIQQLCNAAPVDSEQLKVLQDLAKQHSLVSSVQLYQNADRLPLYAVYPELFSQIAYISLGNFPTPILRCTRLSLLKEHNVKFFIKDDGQSGKLLADGTSLFGGNKVRKLEFVLSDVKKHGAQTVMTFGCVGSNHAVATTVYAHELGLQSVCLLSPQPNSVIVRRNLLLQNYFNGELYYYATGQLRRQGAYQQFLNCYNQDGQFPYVIPTGASNWLGALGFVNAAFELHNQIAKGIVPEPDYIYVAAGSLGTLTGLMIGVRAAGLKSKVVGVFVENATQEALEQRILTLVTDTNNALHEMDGTFPLYHWSEQDIIVTRDFAGVGYGVFTQKGTEAIRKLKEVEGVGLDGVY